MNALYEIIGILKNLLLFPSGKPTITSVVSAGFPRYFLRSPHFSAYSALLYLRFIRSSVVSHPLCRDRWKCGHIFGNAAMLCTNSSVMIPGSRSPDGFVRFLLPHVLPGSGKAVFLSLLPGNLHHKSLNEFLSERLPCILYCKCMNSSITCAILRLLTRPLA